MATGGQKQSQPRHSIDAKGRSKKKRFVRLFHDMMDSAAFLALRPVDRCVYLALRQRYSGYNNGEIPLSCREAAELCNISKGTAASAFNALREKGFIDVATEAGFNQKGGRRSRRWRLTDYPHEGRQPTNEWRKWKPESG